jgi:hypothetical protein
VEQYLQFDSVMIDFILINVCNSDWLCNSFPIILNTRMHCVDCKCLETLLLLISAC